MNVLHINAKKFGVVEKALSVGENILFHFKSTDELLEFAKDRVMSGLLVDNSAAAEASSVAEGLRLIAVVDSSFIPTRHLWV